MREKFAAYLLGRLPFERLPIWCNNGLARFAWKHARASQEEGEAS